MKQKEKEKEEAIFEETKESYKKFVQDHEKKRPGYPPWFSF